MHVLGAKDCFLAERHCCELDLSILKLVEVKAIGAEDMLLLPAFQHVTVRITSICMC